jgi:transcriptional regulator with XRE-family HTH domain
MLTFDVDQEERNKRIGARIRQARELKGWSQDALADELNTKQATVSQWESGSFPKRIGLPAIAEALGQTVEWFLRDDDNPLSAIERRLKMLEANTAGISTLESDLLINFRALPPHVQEDTVAWVRDRRLAHEEKARGLNSPTAKLKR